MKVLIVDDSVMFRTAIKAALADQPGIEIAGTAANGKIALAKLANERVDLMILDLEMPEMDGLQTLQEMSQRQLSVPTLVYSATSEASYRKAMSALKLGARDFLAKPDATTSGDSQEAIERMGADLIPRIRQLAAKGGHSAPAIASTGVTKRNLSGFLPDAVVIASSTGGPMALETLFSTLKAPSRVPLFLVQHMPPTFTKMLAQRLEELSGIPTREAVQGEAVVANRVYVAPGDWHMRLSGPSTQPEIHLFQGPKINYVRPAADPLFESAAGYYHTKLMAFVLTGMGEDGKEGAIKVKQCGGGVMIQDQPSSVVWGMPGAVAATGAFDEMGSIQACAAMLKRMIAA